MFLLRKLFGLLALLMGGSTIVWVLYNLLVERQPEFDWHWWQGFGVGIPFITVGWYWLSSSPGKKLDAGDNQ